MHLCVMFVMRSATEPKTTAAASCSDKTKVIHDINVTNNSVHTILLPQNYFCYLVLNLVAKVCYHKK